MKLILKGLVCFLLSLSVMALFNYGWHAVTGEPIGEIASIFLWIFCFGIAFLPMLSAFEKRKQQGAQGPNS